MKQIFRSRTTIEAIQFNGTMESMNEINLFIFPQLKNKGLKLNTVISDEMFEDCKTHFGCKKGDWIVKSDVIHFYIISNDEMMEHFECGFFGKE